MLRALLREHLTLQLGATVAAGYSSMKFTSNEVADLESIDLFLIDADLPDQSPLPGIRTLLAQRPTAKVALITDVPGAYLAECTAQHGLRGLLHKRDSLDSFVAAVKSVLAGGLWISPQIDQTGRADFSRILSEREIEVMTLLAQGHDFVRIAGELNIEPSTVGTHKRNLMRKLAIRSRLGLALHALSSGLVSADRLRAPTPCPENPAPGPLHNPPKPKR